MTCSCLNLIDVGLSCAGRLLFTQLNLCLAPRTITCILGLSGIGKSSLLKLIAGLITQSNYSQQGAINYGQDTNLHHRVAYMAQEDALLPWCSVLTNITIGTQLRGARYASETINSIINHLRLSPLLHRYPYQLSGGERQRVALARTLVDNKPIVLLDEPFAALDVATRSLLQDYARIFLADKIVLWVTHDPLEALRVSDTIYLMQGSPAVLVQAEHVTLPAARDLRDPILLNHYHSLLAQLLPQQENPLC